MLDTLATGISIGGLALAVWAGLLAYLRRATGAAMLGVLGIAELAVLTQAVVAVVLLIGGQHPAELATFIGYLAFSVLILPAGALWAQTEPGRWGNGVLAVACLTVAVMTVRMGQLWDVPGG